MTDIADIDRRLERTVVACEAWVAENPERCLALHITRRGETLLARGFGVMHPLADPAGEVLAQPDTIFLVASMAKPVTVAALCLLVDRGRVWLDDPVSAYLPDFAGSERALVLVRHLLTHSSGLPDMLPENIELRQEHAPLSIFVERTCSTPLLYTPGTDCRYQSMGILLAGAIVERVSGMLLPDFLAQEFFMPLGMHDSWLGLGTLRRQPHRPRHPAGEEAGQSWTWNSAYWRKLGAPWGGLHTTAGDYAALLHLMLGQGEHKGKRIFSRQMVVPYSVTRSPSCRALHRSANSSSRGVWGGG